jgi:hypothetical protein
LCKSCRQSILWHKSWSLDLEMAGCAYVSDTRRRCLPANHVLHITRAYAVTDKFYFTAVYSSTKNTVLDPNSKWVSNTISITSNKLPIWKTHFRYKKRA